MKFRKKPVVIEAMQWFDNKIGVDDPFWKWITADCEYDDSDGLVNMLEIATLKGNHEVTNGDWIIKGVKGEFYPCKPDIFEMSYEPVD